MRIRTGLTISWAACALTACVAELEPGGEQPVGSVSAPIIGGTNTNIGDFPTVVAISNGGLCTGTLVAPTIILTAAHCIHPQLLGMSSQEQVTANTDVVFDSNNLFQNGVAVPATETIRNPGFSINGLGDNDIGIIRIAAPFDGRAPTPINRNFNNAPPGVAITQVGFGVSQPGNQNSAGILHTLASKTTIDCSNIGESNALLLCYAQNDGTGKCSGDSGGPSFLNINGKQVVVGVTSFGDQNCTQFGADTRVDGELDWLLSVAPELACGAEGECNMACGQGGLPQDLDCPTCTVDADCGDANKECNAGFCEPKPGTPGGVGSTCTSSAECNSGICAGGPDGMRCTELCDPNAPTCPEDFDCLSTGGGGGACWPGAGFDPDDDDDGGGPCACRAGGADTQDGPGLPIGSAMVSLLALVGLVITRSRRKRS